MSWSLCCCGDWALTAAPEAMRSQCARWYAADCRRRGDHAPNGADGLAFRWGAIESDGLLSWGHQRYGRGFLRKVFVIFGRDILNVETQISMKAPFSSDDFS